MKVNFIKILYDMIYSTIGNIRLSYEIVYKQALLFELIDNPI